MLLFCCNDTIDFNPEFFIFTEYLSSYLIHSKATAAMRPQPIERAFKTDIVSSLAIDYLQYSAIVSLLLFIIVAQAREKK